MASISITDEDLSCPVCKGIFRDPVILSCSHSFCEDCVKTSWETRGDRQCPVCRASSEGPAPVLNLHLRNLCETFQQEGNRRGLLCKLHRSELKLFCKDDKQLICLVCRDSKLHDNHNFSPVSEAAAEYMEELKRKLEAIEEAPPACKRAKTTKRDDPAQHIRDELAVVLPSFKEKLDALEKAKETFDETAQHIQVQAQQAEKYIKEVFDLFHHYLRFEEESWISELKEEEEQKSQMMKEKIEKMSREISSLSDTIRAMEEALQSNDVTFQVRNCFSMSVVIWTADALQFL
ncbi:E3 ubiquitin-protein ligase TRIM35-like [Engraulis encrasicolus]|uniref:E3 ubiquitin-protein ligase TRIM35-like n=1 Tax=Engraulis encrasicolus TaxID=184585 RepID=UPI002FD24554